MVVALEARRGLVTAEDARDYGDVVTNDHEVDADATEELCVRVRDERGEVSRFDLQAKYAEVVDLDVALQVLTPD